MSRIREIPSARGVDTETLEVQIFDEDDDGSDGLHERAAYDSKPE